jgi:two-component system, OmpR family, sensor histidine kinase KdpD
MEQPPGWNSDYLEPPPWPTGARIMVCVGYNPASQRLIQRASDLARALGGELIALHIQPTKRAAPGYQLMLEHNMKLANQLGARILIERGSPLAEVLARVAQANRVTHLVMGESARSRLDEIRRGSLVRQVLSATRGIDVYIVADPA